MGSAPAARPRSTTCTATSPRSTSSPTARAAVPLPARERRAHAAPRRARPRLVPDCSADDRRRGRRGVRQGRAPARARLPRRCRPRPARARGRPRPRSRSRSRACPGLDFSFSGVKTALLYAVRDLGAAARGATGRSRRLVPARARPRARGADARSRGADREPSASRSSAASPRTPSFAPRCAGAAFAPLELCTDNAAMIASAARYVEAVPYPGYLALDAYASGRLREPSRSERSRSWRWPPRCSSSSLTGRGDALKPEPAAAASAVSWTGLVGEGRAAGRDRARRIVVLKAPSLASASPPPAARRARSRSGAGRKRPRRRRSSCSRGSRSRASGSAPSTPSRASSTASRLRSTRGRSRCSSAPRRWRASIRSASAIRPPCRRPRREGHAAGRGSRAAARPAAARLQRPRRHGRAARHGRRPRTPYLRGRVQGGTDIVGGAGPATAKANPDEPADVERHGTEMAGLIVGRERAVGLRGIAPGATLFPIRVAGWQRDAAGDWAVYGRTDQLIAGLERAVDPERRRRRARRRAGRPRRRGRALRRLRRRARVARGRRCARLDTLVVAPAGNDGPAGPGVRQHLRPRRSARSAHRRRGRPPPRDRAGPCRGPLGPGHPALAAAPARRRLRARRGRFSSRSRRRGTRRESRRRCGSTISSTTRAAASSPAARRSFRRAPPRADGRERRSRRRVRRPPLRRRPAGRRARPRRERRRSRRRLPAEGRGPDARGAERGPEDVGEPRRAARGAERRGATHRRLLLARPRVRRPREARARRAGRDRSHAPSPARTRTARRGSGPSTGRASPPPRSPAPRRCSPRRAPAWAPATSSGCSPARRARSRDEPIDAQGAGLVDLGGAAAAELVRAAGDARLRPSRTKGRALANDLVRNVSIAGSALRVRAAFAARSSRWRSLRAGSSCVPGGTRDRPRRGARAAHRLRGACAGAITSRRRAARPIRVPWLAAPLPRGSLLGRVRLSPRRRSSPSETFAVLTCSPGRLPARRRIRTWSRCRASTSRSGRRRASGSVCSRGCATCSPAVHVRHHRPRAERRDPAAGRLPPSSCAPIRPLRGRRAGECFSSGSSDRATYTPPGRDDRRGASDPPPREPVRDRARQLQLVADVFDIDPNLVNCSAVQEGGRGLDPDPDGRRVDRGLPGLPRDAQHRARPVEGRHPLPPGRHARRGQGAGDVDDVEVRADGHPVRRREGRRRLQSEADVARPSSSA